MGISSAFSKLVNGGTDLGKVAKKSASKLTKNVMGEVADVAQDLDIDFGLNGFENKAKETYDNYRNNKKLWKYKTKKKTETKTQGQGVKGAAKRAGVNIGVEVEDFVERVAVGTGKIGYKLGKGMTKAMVKKPVKNDDKFFGYDIGATKFGAVAVTGLAFGLPIAGALIGTEQRANHGEISGGLVAKSVNASFSQGTSNVFDAAHSGAMSMRDFNKTVGRRNGAARYGGVNPDIVFAMHTLRNNQDMLNNEVVH